MKTDLYTKIILTAIAALLAVTVFVSTSPQTVKAQGGDYWIRTVQADKDGLLKAVINPKGNTQGPLPGPVLFFSCVQSGCYAVGK